MEEQKCIRKVERKKKRGTVSFQDFDGPITVTQKDTIQFIDPKCNLRKYKKLLKNESIQFTKKEISKALNSEGDKRPKPEDEQHMLKQLREQQEKEQKALHLFGFVNKNRYNEVDEIEEETKPVEKSRIKNKQHKNRAENDRIIAKQRYD